MLEVLSLALARATGRERIGIEARLRGLVTRVGSGGQSARIGRNVTMVCPDRVRFGKRVCLWGNTYLNAGGPTGKIDIGDDSHLDQFCLVSGLGGITIGARCAISSGVLIYSHTNQFDGPPEVAIIDQPVRFAPVTLGDDILVGARVVILPGVTVGDHAVIGAGAVVTRDVPPWAIVAGVPAAVIGDRREGRSAKAHARREA